ncbi:MAG: 4Fe-4S binding protein [Chloroflexi bacterium]|nr:4Fe-4S binding protein [Chloroflexota bacterium]
MDYENIRWDSLFCKRCFICVEICPTQALVLKNDAIVEVENCIRCTLCERYCPDMAIEVIPPEEGRGTEMKERLLRTEWPLPVA